MVRSLSGFTAARILISLLALVPAFGAATAPSAEKPIPIIDVHHHVPFPDADDEAGRREVLETMRQNGIVLTLVSVNEPSDLDLWSNGTVGPFLAGVAMPCWINRDSTRFCFPETAGWPDLQWLERELSAGRIGFLGEMLFNYTGISPDDARMRPYWALAAKYDVPVLVHTGRGPGPGQGPRKPNCCPDYNAAFGNPDLLRPILARHPNLRIVLAHFGAGSPDHPYYRDEALALLRDYPSVHVDITILNFLAPPAALSSELRGLVEGGFGKRILFGTDDMPAAPILARFAAIDWLNAEQRRDILHDNAARFLRLGVGPPTK